MKRSIKGLHSKLLENPQDIGQLQITTYLIPAPKRFPYHRQTDPNAQFYQQA